MKKKKLKGLSEQDKMTLFNRGEKVVDGKPKKGVYVLKGKLKAQKVLEIFSGKLNYSKDKGRFVEVEDKKDYQLKIRLNSLQKQLFDDYLEKKGVKASDLIRGLLAKEIAGLCTCEILPKLQGKDIKIKK